LKIRKVVIPAAGLGTRFLPITKVIPKEMLPLLNKPAIQYIVEEAIDSKLDNFLVVISKGKEAIENYFNSSTYFDYLLKEKQQTHLLSGLSNIIKSAKFSYVEQKQQLGLGHAILMAKEYIKEDYFCVMLPDDIIVSDNPGINQLIEIATKTKSTVVAVQEIPLEFVSSYGIVSIKSKISDNIFQLNGLVEKPKKLAPSNLAIVGRYVISNKIFSSLEKISSTNLSELQLTDAISHMLQNGEPVIAVKIDGERYDVGTPQNWLRATIELDKKQKFNDNNLNYKITKSIEVPDYL